MWLVTILLTLLAPNPFKLHGYAVSLAQRAIKHERYRIKYADHKPLPLVLFLFASRANNRLLRQQRYAP